MCDSDEELEIEIEEWTCYPSDYIRDSDGSYIADIERRTPGIENLNIHAYDPAASPDEWRALRDSIGGSNLMRTLDVCPDCLDENVDEVSTEMFETFLTGVSRNRSLKSLMIQEFQFTHARLKLEALLPIFSHNRYLTHVTLSNCQLSVLDIQGLANAIRQDERCSPIKQIHLGDVTIGDDSVPAIIDVYNACPRLKVLNLSSSTIGDRGCTELASMLFRDTKLKVFSVTKNSFGDEGALALANAIAHNCKLTILGLGHCSNITARGWRGIFRTLCDTSSINGTYQSNHTIEKIRGHLLFDNDGNLPEICGIHFSEDLLFCLQANSATDKSISSRKKIFRFHMSDAFDLSPFFKMDALVLPQLLGWVGTDYGGNVQNDIEPNRKRSAFYRILRNFPDLCGYPSWERKLRCRLEQEIDKLEVENANLKRKTASGEDENAKLKRRIEQLMSENAELKSIKRPRMEMDFNAPS